jgi:hypothetical protein
MKSPCAICREKVSDITKRFVPAHGFCCVECHSFTLKAEKFLRKVGIEGTTVAPVRFNPKTEAP